MPRHLIRGFLAGAFALSLLGAGTALAGAGERDIDAFRGLGAWIDVFDYVPAFKQRPGPVPIAAGTIDDLAALGADTIYLQVAIDDPRAEGLIVDRKRVGDMLRRAHDADLDVVAWYYPQLVDPARDRMRLEALVKFRSGGERFDAIAVDIESRQVPDVKERNKRVVRLVGQVRKKAGSLAIGAIVYPAVQLEVINPNLWPDFPYQELGEHIDAWLPMTYWTFRTDAYRDAFVYTEESVRRLRRNLDDRDANVHPIGGLGATSLPEDYAALVKAARKVDALGWSVYDVDSMSTSAWRLLRDDDS